MRVRGKNITENDRSREHGPRIVVPFLIRSCAEELPVRNLSQTARGMPRERAWPASNDFARGTETIENVRFVTFAIRARSGCCFLCES